MTAQPLPYAPPVQVPVRVRRPDTACARWSVFLGIQSILLGAILPIPIAAIILGIIALCRDTLLPGRAAAGIAIAASSLPLWGGFIALCVTLYLHRG